MNPALRLMLANRGGNISSGESSFRLPGDSGCIYEFQKIPARETIFVAGKESGVKLHGVENHVKSKGNYS
jgi:hypothetical protein